ncbi:MAG: DedA family protein, partial [bacterium]
MTDWLDAIMAWIQANPGLAGIVIASTAFLESLALVGILVPGALILFGIGALVGLGAISLAEAWFWSSVGAILGDGLSYWLGSHYRERLNNIWPFSRFTQLIAQGQKYFKKHGGKSIFIGRFVGPIRPVVPLIAGMLKMPVKYYIPINIIAGILWSPAYILPGVVLGASLDLAATVAWRLVIVILIFVGLLWLIYWFFKRVYTFLSPRVDRQLDALLNWCHRHPHIGPVIA